MAKFVLLLVLSIQICTDNIPSRRYAIVPELKRTENSTIEVCNWAIKPVAAVLDQPKELKRFTQWNNPTDEQATTQLRLAYKCDQFDYG